jgi:hypothetical protein
LILLGLTSVVSITQERDMLMSASHDGTVRLWAAQV